jgi:hypothetical protein
VLYSFACVCVGVSDSTTASDDPSSSLFVLCASGAFLGGSQGGGRYAPPGYAQCSAMGPGAAPRYFVLGGFCYF